MSVGIIFVLLTAVFFVKKYLFLPKNILLSQETRLVILPDIIKLNYNFYTEKKEIYAVKFNNLDLSHYRTLSFNIRKTNPKDTLALRIELANVFEERAEVYLKNISSDWQSVNIPLSDFKKISQWQKIRELAFIVEEWNSKEKNNVLYLEQIQFLK